MPKWKRSVAMAVALVGLLAVGATGCACARRVRGTYAPLLQGEPPAGRTRVVLWFSGPGGEAIPVTRDLPATRAQIWTAIAALCAGPTADSGLRSPLPSDVRLRKVVYRGDANATGSAVDLDFSPALGRPSEAARTAIARTLAQFATIDSARLLVAAVPVVDEQQPGRPLLLKPPELRGPLQFLPVEAGARLWLAARPLATPARADLAAAVEALLEPSYIRKLLPRDSEIRWTRTPGPAGESLAVTVSLRQKQPTDRDWAALQVAADALALSLRSLSGMGDITVRMVSRDAERTFIYAGALWPNPEAAAGRPVR